jgi:aminoglycoside phosphotransferase (APT) family kinase protein
MRIKESFELSLEKVEWILEQHKLGELSTIKVIEKGVVNPIYEINGKYILRIHTREPHLVKLEKEAFIYETILKKKSRFPVPQVINLDTSKTLIPHNYMLMTKIEGKDLDDAWTDMSMKKRKDISFRLGKVIAHLHKIKMKSFGGIMPSERKYKTWHGLIHSILETYAGRHRHYNVVPKKTINAIEKYFKKNKDLFKIKIQPVLLHGDWHRENIRVHKNRISGVFDFEWALAGHNEFDFKNIMPLSKREKILQSEIIEGYKSVGKLAKDFRARIKLYVMINCLDFLEATHVHWGDDPHYIKKYLDNLDKELE